MGTEHDLDFIFVPAKIGFGKDKDVLCTNNNIPLWYRYNKTKIKNTFKDHVTQWLLPEHIDNPYITAEIRFTIHRPDNRKIDADAFGVSSYKWIIDILVEQSYLIDDDKCKIILEPAVLSHGSVETVVRMEVKFNERFNMTLEDLKENAEKLNAEMQIFFSPSRTKAGSGRIRKILGEIKNATPGLRRDLMDTDNKK